MRNLRFFAAIGMAIGGIATYENASAASPRSEVQDYLREPMPPGIQVVHTEIEGPVFADARGHTLYRWPASNVRNGSAGDSPGKSNCTDVSIKETAGLMSIYPAGELLPFAETRPSCVQHWPPLAAPAGAAPVGNFTIIKRADGIDQWAYRGYPLYLSHRDSMPGETNGARNSRNRDTNSSVPREVAIPAPAVPAQFKVATMELGRMLATARGVSVYAHDKDTSTKTGCYDACLNEWAPVLAPAFAVPQGEWSVLERRDGARQWVYRGKPLYTHVLDTQNYGYMGSDVPGWKNVYMQFAPNPPKDFGIAVTHAGLVRTAPGGKTIYFYQCGEDSADALLCDGPDDPQQYRYAVCGGGDPHVCLQRFPYVIADKNAKSDSIAWSVRNIDPKTGRYVAPDTPGSLHIWTFRGRPIYTFAGDKEPGDIEADSWGQDHGQGNGFTAFWVRDDFDTLDGGARN